MIRPSGMERAGMLAAARGVWFALCEPKWDTERPPLRASEMLGSGFRKPLSIPLELCKIQVVYFKAAQAL